MNRHIKIGAACIAIGICLPLCLLFFVSGYQHGAGFINNLLGLKIMITLFNKHSFGIPYRIFVAIGVVFVFIGVRQFDYLRKKPGEKNIRDE